MSTFGSKLDSDSPTPSEVNGYVANVNVMGGGVTGLGPSKTFTDRASLARHTSHISF